MPYHRTELPDPRIVCYSPAKWPRGVCQMEGMDRSQGHQQGRCQEAVRRIGWPAPVQIRIGYDTD